MQPLPNLSALTLNAGLNSPPNRRALLRLCSAIVAGKQPRAPVPDALNVSDILERYIELGGDAVDAIAFNLADIVLMDGDGAMVLSKQSISYILGRVSSESGDGDGGGDEVVIINRQNLRRKKLYNALAKQVSDAIQVDVVEKVNALNKSRQTTQTNRFDAQLAATLNTRATASLFFTQPHIAAGIVVEYWMELKAQCDGIIERYKAKALALRDEGEDITNPLFVYINEWIKRNGDWEGFGDIDQADIQLPWTWDELVVLQEPSKWQAYVENGVVDGVKRASFASGTLTLEAIETSKGMDSLLRKHRLQSKIPTQSKKQLDEIRALFKTREVDIYAMDHPDTRVAWIRIDLSEKVHGAWTNGVDRVGVCLWFVEQVSFPESGWHMAASLTVVAHSPTARKGFGFIDPGVWTKAAASASVQSSVSPGEADTPSSSSTTPSPSTLSTSSATSSTAARASSWSSILTSKHPPPIHSHPYELNELIAYFQMRIDVFDEVGRSDTLRLAIAMLNEDLAHEGSRYLEALVEPEYYRLHRESGSRDSIAPAPSTLGDALFGCGVPHPTLDRLIRVVFNVAILEYIDFTDETLTNPSSDVNVSDALDTMQEEMRNELVRLQTIRGE